MEQKRRTAHYRITSTDTGNQYEFFCDLSNALVCVSEPIVTDPSDDELMLAWEQYGKAHFNQCRKCGKWVSEVMYNPDVFHCVKCTPLEDYPNYCPECGAKAQNPSNFCHICGAKLFYGGEGKNEK